MFYTVLDLISGYDVIVSYCTFVHTDVITFIFGEFGQIVVCIK